jgi:ubiquitin carboxyl-terminal hydrolase 7
MKGTQADGAIKRLFSGTMKSYVKCIDIDFESARTEDFYGKHSSPSLSPAFERTDDDFFNIWLDIQLNVKNLSNLEESFKDYIQVETLEGENKYNAEGFGLQDAKKGVIFESFPPVLHLQLKRFEYDMQRDQNVKVNKSCLSTCISLSVTEPIVPT